MSANASVRSDLDHSRYEYVEDDEVLAVADYRLGPGYVVMHHTYTEPAHRGRGIAAALVAGALDDLRRRGLRVVATCWYVQEFIDEHPAYHDLLHQHSRKPGTAGIAW